MADTNKVYPLRNRRELFLDDQLTAAVSGETALRQHFPNREAPAPSRPVGYYQTNIQERGKRKEEDFVRCYYRGIRAGYNGDLYDGNPGEYTGYAESRDGIHWSRPELGLFPDYPDFPGDTIWVGTMETHNFAPFRDDNPGCPPEERYKAVAGIRDCGGLFRFCSADGIRWRKMSEEPCLRIPEGGYLQFDSQNVCFWSAAEQCYVIYFRVYVAPDAPVLPASPEWDDACRRSVARSTSTDFLHWTEPVVLKMNRPGEHLYVSLLAPYFRAPHIYIGTPTRFFGARGAATDITFCHTRNGIDILRPFPGAWITPGPDPARWGNRSNYLAYGIVQTGPKEISLYHCISQVRYTLRLDGFASLHAGVEGGTWESVPMEYAPGRWEFNVATSAGGAFQVGFADAEGRALPGFDLDDCELFFGDDIAVTPRWKGGEEPPLRPGQPFRLRFRMTECDVFSFCCSQQLGK